MSTTPRPLTDKEGEVFRLMAVGLTNDAIAIQIETGADNVKKHIASIFNKLGASNRAQAISLGYRGKQLIGEDIDELAERLGFPKPQAPQASSAQG